MRAGQLVRLASAVLVPAVAFGACGSARTIGTTPPAPTASSSALGKPSPSTNQAAMGRDFLMYKGNVGRTGEVAGTGPEGDVTTLWSVETSGPVSSSPVVVGDEMYIVSGDGHILSLDVATGTQQWSSADGGYAGNLAASSTQLF